jgi:preprotein translocase subunit SecB
LSPSRPLSTIGQLDSVILREVSFSRNLGFDTEKGGVYYTLDAWTEGHATEDHRHGMTDLHLRVEWHDEQDEQTEGPFDLELIVSGFFEWGAPELQTDEIEGWLAFNGEHLLWPYARSYVSQITTEAGLPPLVIYTIGVPRPHLGRTDESATEAPGA